MQECGGFGGSGQCVAAVAAGGEQAAAAPAAQVGVHDMERQLASLAVS